MTVEEMRALVDVHLKAEGAGDVEKAVSVYTDDVVHDAVGFPGSPRRGRAEAREFYAYLTANFRTVEEEVVRSWTTEDALIMEQVMTGDVIGTIMGLPGHGRRISFRILHVFEFSDGLISRENVWLDGGAIQQQLLAA